MAKGWDLHGTYAIDLCIVACSARSDGLEMMNLASNNYLGLTDHPKLIEATMEARPKKYRDKYGAVRTIAGTMSISLELERRIAAW